MKMRQMSPGDKVVLTDGSCYEVAPDGDWVYDGGIPLITPGWHAAMQAMPPKAKKQ